MRSTQKTNWLAVSWRRGEIVGTDLIRSVTDDDLELRQLGQIRLDEVTQHNLQLLLLRRPLHLLGQFGRHAGIQFHRNDVLRLLQNSARQDTRTRTNFKNGLGRLDIRLVDDVVCDRSIFQNVLTDVGVEFEEGRARFACCALAALGGLLVWRRRGPGALLSLSFAHGEV